MAVKVTFMNGEQIVIDENTYILAWKSEDDSGKQKLFYSKMIAEGSRLSASNLGSYEPIASLEGLFGTADWFSLRENPKIIYKTSAILYLENE